MNRFMEMSHVELAEALENSINSIEASGGTGDWYDAVVEARRRLSAQEPAQTFFAIKRDEEPRYWDDSYGWSKEHMSLMTDEGSKSSLEWLHENSAVYSVKTARIVKVMVSEVEG